MSAQYLYIFRQNQMLYWFAKPTSSECWVHLTASSLFFSLKSLKLFFCPYALTMLELAGFRRKGGRQEFYLVNVSIDVFILYSLPRVAGYFKQNFSLIGAPDEHESAFASFISLTFLLKAVLRCGMSTQSAGRRKDKASVLGIQRWRKIASRAPFGHVPWTSEYTSKTMGWARGPWERHEYLLGNFKDGERSWLSMRKLYL